MSTPHLVLPITVQPSKPCLCRGERFLNFWIRNLSFKKWITFWICLGMLCLGTSRLPLSIKVGISMSSSIHHQTLILSWSEKISFTCFVRCLLVRRKAPLSMVLSFPMLLARLGSPCSNILTIVMWDSIFPSGEFRHSSKCTES